MIKNIVFDVGNVLVKWDPLAIVQKVFPNTSEQSVLAQKIFKSKIWFDLNLGKTTEDEAMRAYQVLLNIESEKIEQMRRYVKESLLPLNDTIHLVKRLHKAQFPLYIITDNTKEIMQLLTQRYDFWEMFLGVVVSAEIGHLKPSPHIYQHLLNTYKLNPTETVFFDDLITNVEGARAVNMVAFQFTNAEQCEVDLKSLKIVF